MLRLIVKDNLQRSKVKLELLFQKSKVKSTLPLKFD